MASKELREWILELEDAGEEVSYIDIANFKKRNYAHFRMETLSCKVREEEKYEANYRHFNLSKPLADYIRGWLLYDETIKKLCREEFPRMNEEDYSMLTGLSKEILDKLPPRKQFLYSQMVHYMDRSEVKTALALTKVVSTRLRGYEKEIFWLRCLAVGILPVVVLRLGVRVLGKYYQNPFPSQEEIPLHDLI